MSEETKEIKKNDNSKIKMSDVLIYSGSGLLGLGVLTKLYNAVKNGTLTEFKKSAVTSIKFFDSIGEHSIQLIDELNNLKQ